MCHGAKEFLWPRTRVMPRRGLLFAAGLRSQIDDGPIRRPKSRTHSAELDRGYVSARRAEIHLRAASGCSL
jgi:hypothetical protein